MAIILLSISVIPIFAASIDGHQCKIGRPASGYFSGNGEDVNLYEKPSAASRRVLNEVGSRVTGSKMYRTINGAYKLQALCEKGNWIKGKIIRMDEREVNGEIGWVQRAKTTGHTQSEPPKNLPAANYDECIVKGEAFFKSVKAWPRLPDGRDAKSLAQERCGRVKSSFDSSNDS